MNNTAIFSKSLKNSNSFVLKSKVRKHGMQNKLRSSILQNMKPLSIVLKNMENKKVTCRKDTEVTEIACIFCFYSSGSMHSLTSNPVWFNLNIQSSAFQVFIISILVWVNSGIWGRAQRLYSALCRAVLWQRTQHSVRLWAPTAVDSCGFFYLYNSSSVHLLF